MSNLEPRFLLAHLQIQLLCDQPSLREIRRSLDKAPADLFAFYDVAMARIADQPEARKRLARTALCYLFCARRPLNTGELLHALGVDISDAELDVEAIPDLEFLLGNSAGLIRADTQTGIVGLVHPTLHEYLKLRPEQLLAWPEREMVRVCLIYLNFDGFQSGPCDDANDLDGRLKKYCFFEYASRYWGSHFHHAQADTPDNMDLLQGFSPVQWEAVLFDSGPAYIPPSDKRVVRSLSQTSLSSACRFLLGLGQSRGHAYERGT